MTMLKTFTTFSFLIMILSSHTAFHMKWNCFPECYDEFRNITKLMRGFDMNFSNTNIDVMLVNFKNITSHLDSDGKRCYDNNNMLHIRYDKIPIEIHYDRNRILPDDQRLYNSIKIVKDYIILKKTTNTKEEICRSGTGTYGDCVFHFNGTAYRTDGLNVYSVDKNNTIINLDIDHGVEYRFKRGCFKCYNYRDYLVMYSAEAILALKNDYTIQEFTMRKNRMDVFIAYDFKQDVLMFSKPNMYCVFGLKICTSESGKQQHSLFVLKKIFHQLTEFGFETKSEIPHEIYGD